MSIADGRRSNELFETDCGKRCGSDVLETHAAQSAWAGPDAESPRLRYQVWLQQLGWGDGVSWMGWSARRLGAARQKASRESRGCLLGLCWVRAKLLNLRASFPCFRPELEPGNRAAGLVKAREICKNRIHSHLQVTSMQLSQLGQGVMAVIDGIEGLGDTDPIARRLQDLGFVDGEPVRVIARGPLGGEPLAVQIGFTRFALRVAEAERVRVAVEAIAA